MSDPETVPGVPLAPDDYACIVGDCENNRSVEVPGCGGGPDADDDGDGVPDASDAFPLDASESVDTDGDGKAEYDIVVRLGRKLRSATR